MNGRQTNNTQILPQCPTGKADGLGTAVEICNDIRAQDVAARIQDAIDHRYRGDQVGCIASESVLDWSQEGWDASSRLNGDAAATGGSSGRKLESIEKVRFHYGAGQRKCVGSDQTGFRPSGRALGRHRDPRLIGDAVVNAFKPMVEPKKKLCPQKKRFRSSDIARCRRMAQAADIHFKEWDGGAGLKERLHLFGRKDPITPTLNYESGHGEFRGIKDHGAPINIVLRAACPYTLRVATQRAAKPVKHLVLVIRVRRVETAGKQSNGEAQLRHIIRTERLIKIGPSNDWGHGRKTCHMCAH